MQHSHWILDGHQPIPCSAKQWREWFQTANRRVASNRIAGVLVLTEFSGLNFNFSEGEPLLFESLICTDDASDLTFKNTDVEMKRYATWEEAEAGHQALVAKLKARLLKID